MYPVIRLGYQLFKPSTVKAAFFDGYPCVQPSLPAMGY